jgi:ABC-type multidrug transport system fused ATPase/permease subunit
VFSIPYYCCAMSIDNNKEAILPVVDDVQVSEEQEAEAASTPRNNNETDSKRPLVPLVQVRLENITYSPSTTKLAGSNKNNHGLQKRTAVIKNLSTFFEPYKLTSWMGSSGSGNSSLI